MPLRTYWLAKFIRLYRIYDKYPWELGYKPYVEFDNIFPLMIREINKRMKQEADKERDFQQQQAENQRHR